MADLGAPVIVVVGTGRSGTRSIIDTLRLGGIDAVHEPDSHWILPAGRLYTTGAISEQAAATLLDQATWRPAQAHYAYTPLIQIIDAYLRPTWIRTIRNTDDTVESMCRQGWYRPEDDDLWPVQARHFREHSDGVAEIYDINHAAFRITAVDVGEASWPDWQTWSQEERCRWWVSWCNRTLNRLEDRTVSWRVGEQPVSQIAAQATGLPTSRFPDMWSNRGTGC
jgi:hypothetical protein